MIKPVTISAWQQNMSTAVCLLMSAGEKKDNLSNLGENYFASVLPGERAASQKSGGFLREQSFLLGMLNSRQSSRH